MGNPVGGMSVAYVVLYVDDAALCRQFWIEQLGMVQKSVTEVAGHQVMRVGFADQPFCFELVPLALMVDNPDGLDLATPSVCFSVEDLEATRAHLIAAGVEVSEIVAHGGRDTFGFSDPEGRWFAVAAS